MIFHFNFYLKCQFFVLYANNISFAPRTVDSTVNSQWLYNFVADLWSDWLPADALSTLRVGGYYTFVFRPGFRIIVLNNNHCFVYNT